MNKTNYKALFIKIVEAFMMSWSLSLISGRNSADWFGLVFFVLSLLLINNVRNNNDSRREKILWAVLSFVFSMIILLCDADDWCTGLDNPLFKAAICACGFLGSFLFLFYFNRLLGERLKNVKIAHDITKNESFLTKHIFLITASLCFLAYIPYFLYLYPAVMTPDSLNQLEQAMGIIPYSNHHPWVHTLLIKLCFNIGRGMFQNNNAGIAVYTIFQMIMVSLGAGYSVDTLKRFEVKQFIIYLSILFYAAMPYNSVFAVTMWKDVLFGVAVTAFSAALIRIVFRRSDVIKDGIILFISSVMICLFRSNGWYAFIVTAVILCFLFTRNLIERSTIIIVISSLVLVFLVKYPIMNAFGVIQPDFVESISIPSQQIAFVLSNDRVISEEDKLLIENVIDTTYIKELYAPNFADNIKELIRAGHPEVLEENKGTYFSLYVRLGLKYPMDYLKAYINQTSGYYYPDNEIMIADTEGIPDNRCGVYASPVIGGKVLLKMKEISIKLWTILPLYGLLWCPGAMLWMLMILLFSLLIRRSAGAIIYILPLCLTATILIATPVSGDFRYVYYMFLMIPLFLLSLSTSLKL